MEVNLTCLLLLNKETDDDFLDSDITPKYRGPILRYYSVVIPGQYKKRRILTPVKCSRNYQRKLKHILENS